MSSSFDEPVSVTMMYNHHQHKTVPLELMWRDHYYPITKIDFHQTYKEGDTFKHTFSVISKDKMFELSLDANDLTWRLHSSKKSIMT